MIKIAVAGAQGSGKTTVAMHLCSTFSVSGFITHYVSEYAREYICEKGVPATLEDQISILEGQEKKESIISDKYQLIIYDAPLFISIPYISRLINVSDPESIKLGSSLYKRCLSSVYDIVIMLDKPNEVIKDGIRPDSFIEMNTFIHDSIINVLNTNNIEYSFVTGGIKDKITKVNELITNKYFLKLMKSI